MINYVYIQCNSEMQNAEKYFLSNDNAILTYLEQIPKEMNTLFYIISALSTTFSFWNID